MIERVRRLGLLVAYQLTVLAGIVLMPLALGLRRAGGRFPLPVGRVVDSLGRAYDRASEGA